MPSSPNELLTIVILGQVAFEQLTTTAKAWKNEFSQKLGLFSTKEKGSLRGKSMFTGKNN